MIQDPDEWGKKTYVDIITKSQLEECDHSNFNWVFPKIGVPPNLPFDKVSIINHPFWGTTIFGNSQLAGFHVGFAGCM